MYTNSQKLISIDFQLPLSRKKFFLETQDKFLYCSFPFHVVLAHIVINLRKPWTPKVFQKFFSTVGNHNKDHYSCISHKLIITTEHCMQPSFLTSDWHFPGISWCCGHHYIVFFCLLVWVLFGVLSVFCIMSFGDYSHLKYLETTHFPYNTITFQKYF